MSILVKPTASFEKQYKRLRKKYPQVQATLQSLVAQLEAGETPGDRIQDTDDMVVYKVRLVNKDANKGKSGGFRVIYYFLVTNGILLLSIYTKGEQENLSTRDIRQMIDDADIPDV